MFSLPLHDALPIFDLPDSFSGYEIEKIGKRKGEMLEMQSDGRRGEGGNVMTRLVYRIPARGLFGYRSEFLTDTRGEGQMNHRFDGYGPWVGPLRSRERGVLVSMADGTSTAYALFNLQERGTLFIGPGVEACEGKMSGENST